MVSGLMSVTICENLVFCVVFYLGKMIHSMVAHLDAVTSLAVDPNGIYLMSGSKSELLYCHIFTRELLLDDILYLFIYRP